MDFVHYNHFSARTHATFVSVCIFVSPVLDELDELDLHRARAMTKWRDDQIFGSVRVFFSYFLFRLPIYLVFRLLSIRFRYILISHSCFLKNFHNKNCCCPNLSSQLCAQQEIPRLPGKLDGARDAGAQSAACGGHLIMIKIFPNFQSLGPFFSILGEFSDVLVFRLLSLRFRNWITFERDYDESPVETSMLLRVYFNRARLSVPPQISEHWPN